MHNNVNTAHNSGRLMAIERSLRTNAFHRRSPMLLATDGGKFLKITNSNGSFFKMPMPRGDSVLIEGLFARKIAKVAEKELTDFNNKNSHYPSFPGPDSRAVYSSLEFGKFLRVAFNNGKHSFVIAMPHALSPLVEGLATRIWGVNR